MEAEEQAARRDPYQGVASRIRADLARAGLATSKAGRTGGYRLARSPSEISVLDVVEAAEGPLRTERCTLGEGPCRWSAVCPLHETWSAATAALRELLAGTTLAEVAARDVAIEAGTYSVPPDSHRAHPLVVDVGDVVQVEGSAPDVHAALGRLGTDLADLVATAGVPSGGGPRALRHRPPVGSVEASLVPVVTASATARRSADHADNATSAAGTKPRRGADNGTSATRPGDVRTATEHTYQLSWRLLGRDPTSWLQASLSVQPVDAERSEIRVAGTWHRRSGAVKHCPWPTWSSTRVGRCGFSCAASPARSTSARRAVRAGRAGSRGLPETSRSGQHAHLAAAAHRPLCPA